MEKLSNISYIPSSVIKDRIREIDLMLKNGKYVCGYGHVSRKVFVIELARRFNGKAQGQ